MPQEPQELFLQDCLDALADDEEQSCALSETLLAWLIGEGVFAGPVNSVEDAHIDDVALLNARPQAAGEAGVAAAYTLEMTCLYTDGQGCGRAFTAAFELAGTFAPQHTRPAEQIELLRLTHAAPED